MTQKPVDRKLDDPHLDLIDQALGRPRDPMQATERNIFFENRSFTGLLMANSPYWEKIFYDGDINYLIVTQQGKLHLRAHLKKTGKL